MYKGCGDKLWALHQCINAGALMPSLHLLEHKESPKIIQPVDYNTQ